MKKRKFLSAALSVILSLSMCLSACATPSDDDDDINEDQGTHQPPSGDDDQGGNTPVDPGDDDQGGNTPVDPGDDDQGGDEPGDVHVHDYVWHHTAQKHWQECLGCDDVTAEQDHAWSAWTTIKDPTCTEEGIRTRECTLCGYEAEESISVLAHRWADEYESDADGHWHQCKNCTATSTVESHDYGAWTVTEEATLTSPGTRQRTCKECGYVQEETIPQHDLSDAWEYDATSHWHPCAEPGCDETSEPEAHTWDNAEVTKQPTCTEQGEKTYTCKCGATKTESIPAANHVWGEGYESDANGHWHQCKNCTATSTAESHKYGAWTVTEEATLTSPGTRQRTCEVCDYVQKETIPQHELSDAWEYDATSHWHPCAEPGCDETSTPAPHNGTWQVVKPATCTEAGTEKYTCECGYTQERTVPATNHVWGEEYESDANGHWHVCTAEGCGATSAVESHNWGEWQVVNPATETEQGLRKRSCTLCGYEVTESIPVLGHTHDIDETKWASDAGYHWHACSGCDERVNEAAHEWDKGAVTKQPTCTEEGVMTYKCTVCGYEKTEAIEKIAHDYAEVWSKDETSHWHECTVCGDKADLSAHAWGSGAVTKPATCTEAGEETYTCECGATKTEAIAAAGHKYSAEWSKDATNHWHECTVCGDKKDQVAHEWDEGAVTKQPTCTEEGVKTYTCSVCGQTKTEVIEAQGHDYAEVWSKDETNHWHECTVCHAKTDIAGHAWGSGVVTRPATCTEDGEKTYTCECGATRTEAIAASGHKYATEWSKDETNHWHECTVCGDRKDQAAHEWDEGVVTKQPTCTEEGVKTYTCECGATRTEAIAASGHTPETAWTTDETNHWHVCSVCGAIDEDSKSAHTYGEWVTEEEPTATDEGLKVQICSVCGHRHEETIPATGQPEHTHSWATGWSSDATSHWHACTVDGCAEKSEIAAHDAGSWVTVTEAQIGKDGLSELQCTVCHYVLDSKVIPALPVEPVEGAVQITLAAGDLESAYVEWNELEGADWYNVYYQKSGATDWTQLDQPLVRKYSGESGNYFRADAIGLSAGQYLIKVAAVDETGAEIASSASTTAALTVKAHERYGYAFVNGTSSGAYNEDGTLKSGALVIYVTEANKDSVTATIGGTQYSGIGNIITNIKRTTVPVSIRFIGNITTGANFDKGDFLVDNGGNDIGLTIEGVGKDATADGWGVRLKNSSNVEVRNLGFMNCNSSEGDNIGLQQANDHVWVHNCDLFYGDAGSDADQVKGDGALDTKKSSYVTHSYNHFWDSGKCNLQGNTGESTSNYITYHHNWYDHSDSRHPRIRMATVHIFNNYYDGNAKYGIGVTLGASAFVENNYFRSEVDGYKPMMSSKQGTDALGEGTFSGENGGIIKAYGNVFGGSGTPQLITWQQNNTSFDCYEASTRDEQVPSSVVTLSGGTTYNNFDTASDFYEYEVDTAEEAKAKVEQYAGRVQGGDFKWDFNDATEDGNYAVIPELKEAITNYESSLLEVRGAGASVVNPGGGEQGGEQGGEDQPGGGSIVEGSTLITFEMGGAYSNTVVSGVTITGNPSDSKGSMNVGGTTYNVCLKMESSTKISFTPGEDMTMTLYLDAPGKSITINGEKMTVGSDGTVTVELAAGTAYTITKGDSMNLYAIVLSPLGGDTPGPDTHEHVWAEEWSHNSLTHWHACTVNGCTEKGAEAEHTYSNGKCMECGYEQPSQTVAVTGVTLNRTSATLTVGDSITLVATVAPDNATEKSVSWQSGNSAVASVDQSGKVTALKAGTAVITVTTLDGSKTASCTVTVNDKTQPGDEPVSTEVVFEYDQNYFTTNGQVDSNGKTTVPVTVGNFTVAAGVKPEADVINTQGAENAITFTASGDTNDIYAVIKGASSDPSVLKTVDLKRIDPVTGEVLDSIRLSEDLTSGSTVTLDEKGLPAGTYVIDAEKSVRISGLKVTEHAAPHECALVLVKQAAEATCTAEGNIAYWQCTDPDCGKYYSDAEGKTQITLAETVIPAKGHAKSAAWSYDVSGHWHACLNDGCAEKLEFAAHDTAGANGTCSVCGYKEGHTHSASKVAIQGACQGAVLTEYYLCGGCGAMFRDEACTQALSADDVAAMSAHTLEHHAAVVPGCTQPGNREYWHCTACDNYYSDSAAQNQTSLVDLEIAANGHTFANYVSTANEHYKTCSVCGAVDQSTRGTHTFVDAGDNKQECSVCHYEIDLAAIQNIDSYGAYNESMYVVLKTDNAAGITASYNVSGDATSYSVPQEQIRVVDGKVRIDVVGVSAGTYDMSIGLGSVTVPVEGIQVEAYDRTGYAHFGYDKGIGAYDNDGTLKDGALVIYLTDENKNDITNSAYVYDEATNSYAKVSAADMQKYFDSSVSGDSYSIGYLLNNRMYTDKDAYGIKALCLDYGAVDIRVIGSVSAEVSGTMDSSIEGLTAYNSTENGGTEGDNGRMARIQNAFNLTIEGIGEDAEIYGWGVHFIANNAEYIAEHDVNAGESFEVRNVTFDHYPEDAIGMEGVQEGSVITVPVQRCWIHNNVFMPGYASNPAESDKAEGDGSCDFKRGYYLTFDYNYLYGCHKTNLIGSSDSSLQYNLTYHHNWWHNCGSRIPLTRQANVHFYNNYVSVDANYDGEISYVMSPRANCYIFAEGNYFDGCKNIISGSGGTVKFYNNTFYACYDDIPSQTETREEKVSSNCAYNGTSYSSFELNSSLFYDAEGLLATDSATARKVVMENAGVNGFGYETAPGMNEINPQSALSIPEGGLNIDLSQVGKSSNVQYVNGVAFTNITGTSSGTVKGKGQLATFTISGGAVVTISCSGSGAAAGELIGADGTLYAGKINGTVTVELGSGTYVLASGIKDKELTINSISFEDTGASSQIRIDAAIAAINAIPGTVTLADAEAVSAARFAYDALREDEAAQLDGSLVAKLEAAEATLNTLQVNNVISLIDAIGTVTADSYDAISAARSAYNALPVALRGQISNYAVLTAAEAAFESFEVTNVVNMIDALVATDTIDVTNEAAVQLAYDAYSAAYDAYRLLDSNQQSEVDGAYYDKVVNGTEYLADVLAVYDFKAGLEGFVVEGAGPSELAAVVTEYNGLDATIAESVLTAEDKKLYAQIVAAYEEVASQTIEVYFTSDTGSSNGFTWSGSTTERSGSYNGTTFDTALKMEESTSITFTAAAEMKLTLYFSTRSNYREVMVDGKTYVVTDGVVTVNVSAGSHTISKGDTNVDLGVATLTPAG